MRSVNRSPEKISSLIEDFLDTPAMALAMGEKSLRENWQNILGPGLADIAKLESYAPPTIKVRVEHPAWKMELGHGKEPLLEKLNHFLGQPIIKELIIL